MKNIKLAASMLLIVFAFAIAGSSCKKGDEDAGIPPIINFKHGGSYISSDTTLPKNTDFLVGITAAKSEGMDILKTFSATKTFNGGPLQNVSSIVLTTSQGNNYDTDLTINTGDSTGTAIYTFKVTNKDGHSNSVQLNIVVQ